MVCMWLTLWRPCCSCRTAVYSSRSLAACECAPHLSRASQAKLCAGLGVAVCSLALVTSVTRKHGQYWDGISQCRTQRQEHIDLAFQSPWFSVGEVSLLFPLRLPPSCAEEPPSPCALTVSQEPALGLPVLSQ